MNHFLIMVGHVVDQLRQIPAGTVRTCVTSPPYWGLRDYGTGSWTGGADDCTHEPDRAMPTSTLEGGKSTQGQARVFRDICGHCGAIRVDKQIGLEPTPEQYVDAIVEVFREVRRVLTDDGTLWLNLGDSYVATPRGNRDGDLSTSSLTNPERQDGIDRGDYETAGSSDGEVGRADRADRRMRARSFDGLKAKDLVGIPWRVALALQADGWYLRSDIIWSKPNPMPESVTDRPTKSHEYIFLLAKSGSSTYWTHRDIPYPEGLYEEPPPDYRWKNQQTKVEVELEPADWRTLTYVDGKGETQVLWRRLNLWRGNDYYYDAEAIFEPYAESTLTEVEDGYQGESMKFEELASEYEAAYLQNPSDTKRRIIEGIRKRQGGRQARDLHRNYQKSDETPRLDGERWNENDGRGFLPRELRKSDAVDENGRNVQSVGSEASRRDEPGSSFNNNPRERRKNDDHIDNRKRSLNDWTDEHRGPDGNAKKEITRGKGYGAAKGANGRMPDRDGGFGQPMVGRNKRSVWHVATQPYRKAHFATYPEKLIEPCILAGSRPGDVVLDTFNGSGTTGKVAVGYDRSYIGCELNPTYKDLAVERIGSLSPLFTRQSLDLADFLRSRDDDEETRPSEENRIPDAAPAESLEVSDAETGDQTSGVGG